MQALQSRMSTVRVNALFKGGSAKKAVRGTERTGGVGYSRYQGDALWLPNTDRPGLACAAVNEPLSRTWLGLRLQRRRGGTHGPPAPAVDAPVRHGAGHVSARRAAAEEQEEPA